MLSKMFGHLPVYNISKVIDSRYLATIQRNLTVYVCLCVCVCVKILEVLWKTPRNVISSESSSGKAELLLYANL